MPSKFYQFHYAVMDGHNVKEIGILNYQADKTTTKDDLKVYAREYLKMPEAAVTISHITKLRRAEFEKLTGKKVPD